MSHVPDFITESSKKIVSENPTGIPLVTSSTTTNGDFTDLRRFVTRHVVPLKAQDEKKKLIEFYPSI